MSDVAPDGEAKAADDDERHDGEIHDRVCRVAAEAPAYVCIRKHVKARVAERGDRVEHAVPQSLSEAELRQEAEKQNERPRPLDCGCAAQDIAHKAHDAAVAVAAEGLCQHHALPQADLAAEREEKQTRDGHKAETADLNEQENDDLAEHSPVRPSVDADEARHAGRGGRGEQARQKRRGFAGARCGGQAQKTRAEQDDEEEHQNDQPSRPHGAKRPSEPLKKR